VNDSIRQVDGALAKLKVLLEEQAGLAQKLEHSILIQRHAPDAFEHGPCRISWIVRNGRITHGTLTDGKGTRCTVSPELAAELGITAERLHRGEETE
tara:strand:- start:207 stop:497 length:291 start_codon:yes stop_codon:yes gene_type:complete